MNVSFEFPKGFVFARKYEVISHLGAGAEGDVYLTREIATGIERAAKFFYPTGGPRDEAAKRHAKKLYKIRKCPEIIQYHTHERIYVKGAEVTCLISEYVEGELLCKYIERQKGKRLDYYQGLHLMYAIACGLEVIHGLGEYHGDLHDDNIFVKQVGLGYKIKLIDVIDWRDSRKVNIKKDVVDLIRIFYDSIGGPKVYPKLPLQVKQICCGLRRDLIEAKFRHAGLLRTQLENIEW